MTNNHKQYVYNVVLGNNFIQPAEVFDKLASQSATPRDLAGFRISDFPLDAGIQKIKAKALGTTSAVQCAAFNKYIRLYVP